MRTLRRNKKQLKYSLLIGITDEIAYDENKEPIIEYITEEGEIIYRRTGEKFYEYTKPVSFWGNITFNSGEVQETEFGLDVSQYDAILVTKNDEVPLTETSILWFDNEPQYIDAAEMIVNGKSADYTVLQVKRSINFTKYILGRVNK